MQRIKQRINPKCLLIALAALVLAGGVGSPPVRAADAPVTSPFGSVDVQKVLAGYTKKAAYDQQIQQTQSRLAGYMQQQSNSPMLSKVDQDQLGALLAKANPTADDTATISQLQQKSTVAVQTLATLQQKPNPTAQDSAQLQDLLKQQDAGKQALDATFKGYQDQIQKANDDLSQKLSAEVKAAIVDVARQKGLAVVFDAQVAIYTSSDITDDVVKHLNK